MPTKKKPSGTLAWHILRQGKLRGLPGAPPGNGVPLIHNGYIECYMAGLHASIKLTDAYRYMKPLQVGDVICRVRSSGKMHKQYDKLASSRRTIIWRVTVTRKLLNAINAVGQKECLPYTYRYEPYVDGLSVHLKAGCKCAYCANSRIRRKRQLAAVKKWKARKSAWLAKHKKKKPSLVAIVTAARRAHPN